MEEFDVKDLKGWREKLILSQKRLAELAKISLTTLRQLEFGTHKPQGRTVKKIFEVMKAIESGQMSMSEVKPPRKRRKDAKTPAGVSTPAPAPAPSPVAAATPAPVPKKRGRKPKALTSAPQPAPQPTPKPAPQPAPKPVPRPVPQPLPRPSAPVPEPVVPRPAVAQMPLGPIQLSNLDLELINRILNMTGKEKLALLERLM